MVVSQNRDIVRKPYSYTCRGLDKKQQQQQSRTEKKLATEERFVDWNSRVPAMIVVKKKVGKKTTSNSFHKQEEY